MPFYISKQWLNKFKYFAEPDPISNHDFICAHGFVYPELWSDINDIVVPVTQTVWAFLKEKFGTEANAKCNSLYPCSTCQIEDEIIRKRRLTEKNTFLKLQDRKISVSSMDSPTLITYAISSSWFKEWESFVQAKSKGLFSFTELYINFKQVSNINLFLQFRCSRTHQ